MTRAIALTIAGSDSSGGAGIQADLKTFSVFGVYGASVITALTAQNTQRVSGVLPTPAAFVKAQLDAVATDLTIAAIKTGMLPTADIVDIVADGIERHRLSRVIVDPVMIATSGDALVDGVAIDRLRARLLPLCELVTPNLPEAARLLDTPQARSINEMEAQARAIQMRFGARGVLIKGGHGAEVDAIDVLVSQPGAPAIALAQRRLETSNTHGTGCTLSAAIAALRAQQVPLIEAVTRAKLYVWLALAAAKGFGHGCGPVDHLYHIDRFDPPA